MNANEMEKNLNNISAAISNGESSLARAKQTIADLLSEMGNLDTQYSDALTAINGADSSNSYYKMLQDRLVELQAAKTSLLGRVNTCNNNIALV